MTTPTRYGVNLRPRARFLCDHGTVVSHPIHHHVTIVCELRAGHDGPHQAANREWKDPR